MFKYAHSSLSGWRLRTFIRSWNKSNDVSSSCTLLSLKPDVLDLEATRSGATSPSDVTASGLSLWRVNGISVVVWLVGLLNIVSVGKDTELTLFMSGPMLSAKALVEWADSNVVLCAEPSLSVDSGEGGGVSHRLQSHSSSQCESRSYSSTAMLMHFMWYQNSHLSQRMPFWFFRTGFSQ